MRDRTSLAASARPTTDPGADRLETAGPRARDTRRTLIRDQAARGAIASMLMHYGDENGREWADIIDALTMYPDQRRRVVRLPLDGQPHPSGWFADRLQG